MFMKDKTTALVNGKNKSYILIYKDAGKFYNVRGIDAYIFNDLFGYKVIKNKCGFPDNIINQILERLEDEKISYEVIYTDKDPTRNEFKFNTYKKFYEKAIKSMDIDAKVTSILERIKIADLEKLERILELINENF